MRRQIFVLSKVGILILEIEFIIESLVLLEVFFLVDVSRFLPD
jgi:hypothetical protein